MKILLVIFLFSILSYHSQAQCPANKPDFSTGECKKCAVAYDPYAETPGCVSSCPQNAPTVDSGTGFCASCPDSSPQPKAKTSGSGYECTACAEGLVYDRTQGACKSTCPDGMSLSGSTCVGPPGPRCPTSNAQLYAPTLGFCVGTCPELTASLYNGDCNACTTAKPRWNDTSPDDPQMACLEQCPRNKPDYKTGTLNVCKPCDAGKYWDNTTETCVSQCEIPTPAITDDGWCSSCEHAVAGKQFWDDVAKTCVLACPDTTPSWDENFTCVACNATTPYWLKENYTCLASCPTWARGHDANNFCENGTIEKPVWNATLAKWQDCEENTGTITDIYWDNRTETCTGKCYESSPVFPTTNEYNWCTTCNQSTVPYWNSTTLECQQYCPPTAPASDGFSWCRACTDPSWNWTKVVWVNYGIGFCNETCSMQWPKTNDIGWCEPCARTSPYYNSSVNECQPCVGDTPYYDSDTYQCVAACPAGKPDADSDKWCIPCDQSPDYYWDNFTDFKCIESCSRAYPRLDSNDWCQPCSTAPDIYYNETGNTCVPACESPLPLVGNDNWCESCPVERPYWNPTVAIPDKCVDKCNGTVPLIDYRKICVSCGGANPFWDPNSKICRPKCPDALPYYNSTKICQPCPTGTKWNNLTLHCVPVCPVTIPFVNSINWCSACTGKHYNPATSTCVFTCPVQTPFVDVNNWCKSCPIETPKWDQDSGSCVATCPVSIPKTGPFNWCVECDYPTHWDPITSTCRDPCVFPNPIVNSDNWCDNCPSTTPYWSVNHCVKTCPRQAPMPDDNKKCQPCPSDKPYFDPDNTVCVPVCPAPKPLIGADKWCDLCPSSTPYWFKYNSTCVNFCPPITPSIDDNNWCQECTGGLLKWNPLTNSCVAECPESLPFWNANAIPRACEVGPDIGNIVDYLNTAGLVSTITLAGVQFAWPGIPYVALTILLINVLKYIRYIDINFPDKTMKMFQTDSLNIPSLNFGPLFPEDWKLQSITHPAPERFARYDISGLFIANFWRGISTALIMAFGVGVMKLFLKRKVENEKVLMAREKGKSFLIWNYVFSFFISNIGNIVLFIFIEYRSLYLHDVMGTLSFVLTIVFGQISLAAVMYMIKCIKKVHSEKKKSAKEISPEASEYESFKVLLLKYKNDNLQQMLFIPVMCIRASVNAIFVAAIHAPVVQSSLLVVTNIIFLAYYIKNRPHRALIDNIQLIAFETTLLIADSACVYLSTLPWEEQVEAETAGMVIIVCNVIMFTLSLVFILTRVIIILVRLFKEKFAPKRPNNTVYVQTDVTGTANASVASAASSSQLDRKDSSKDSKDSKASKASKKDNKILSMSFESEAEFNIQTEEDQSPTMKTSTFNKNNVANFHVARIPEDENEQMSKYFETET